MQALSLYAGSAALATNILFSALPRITGLAFDEVLKPAPSAGNIWLAMALAIVIGRGFIDLITLFGKGIGQRLERGQ
ncbi:MAG: hypothetical protein R2867_24440 [Caldilineaceae bacterium]